MSVPDGLLVLLLDGPKHGYQLRSEFEERTGELWSLNTGQVYTTLDRLVRDGFVSSIDAGGADDAVPGDRRRPYELRTPGRERAEAWLARTERPGEVPRDELTIRVLLAVGRSDTAAHGVIDAQRRSRLTSLQELRATQRRAEAPGGLVDRMVADALAVRTEAELRWLDLCEERLISEDRRPRKDALP